jgi:hypothetical protein
MHTTAVQIRERNPENTKIQHLLLHRHHTIDVHPAFVIPTQPPRRIYTNGRDGKFRPALHASPREQQSSRSRVQPQILSIVSKSLIFMY